MILGILSLIVISLLFCIVIKVLLFALGIDLEFWLKKYLKGRKDNA